MRPLSPHTLSSAPIWHENFDKSFAKAIMKVTQEISFQQERLDGACLGWVP